MKPKILRIPQETDEPATDIVLDTTRQGRQALVFCSSKRGAEAQAEKIAGKLPSSEKFKALAEKALHALSSPTKQCQRLAKCLSRGVAFHHAGLHSAQRTLIEDEFRAGTICCICATPTLAMGIDTPAFRSIIKDYRRFGRNGMTDISVIEYEQCAGRAGRPGREDFGEAILIAASEGEAERLVEKYVHGEPEEIYSKLAVEPVLRMYVLSLIASEFVTTKDTMHEFFDSTFYAHQYGDTMRLHQILDRVTTQLQEWEFLVPGAGAKSGFLSAAKLRDEALAATPIGKRVAELYLDPFTAHELILAMERAMGMLNQKKALSDFGWLQLLCSCLEMRPLLRPRVKEVEDLYARSNKWTDTLLVPEPSQYSDEYEDFLMSLKTALFLHDWIEEKGEDDLLEAYQIRPGEVHAKLDIADWLVFGMEELSRMLAYQAIRAPLARLRLRLQHGAKEELLALLKLKGIGRVRARKLHNAGIHDVGDVKRADTSTLAHLVGPAIAKDIKAQVGEEADPEKLKVPTGKKKGQRSMDDYRE